MKVLVLRFVFSHWLIIMATVLAGCAGTRQLIVNEWRNPAYVAPVFKTVMVGGLSEQTSIRRNFEDEFVAQLRAAGVKALPSYQYIPEGEKVDEAKLKQAARKSGADAALSARSVSVEQKTEVGPSYYPMPSFGIFGRHVSGVWSGPYGAPSVTRYTEYTSETTLYDLAKDGVVWSATVKTSEPENVQSAIKGYVEAVINALKEKEILGGKK